MEVFTELAERIAQGLEQYELQDYVAQVGLYVLIAGAAFWLLVSLIGTEIWRLVLGLFGAPIGFVAGFLLAFQFAPDNAPANTPLTAGGIGLVVTTLLFVLVRPVGSFVVAGIMGFVGAIGVLTLPQVGSNFNFEMQIAVASAGAVFFASLAATMQIGKLLSASLLGGQLCAWCVYGLLALKAPSLTAQMSMENWPIAVVSAGGVLGLLGLWLQAFVSGSGKKQAKSEANA